MIFFDALLHRLSSFIYIYIYSFLGEGNSSPLQYSCLEKNGQRSLAGYSPWGLRVEVAEWLSTHIPFHILLLRLLQDIEYSSLCYLMSLFTFICIIRRVLIIWFLSFLISRSLWKAYWPELWCPSRHFLILHAFNFKTSSSQLPWGAVGMPANTTLRITLNAGESFRWLLGQRLLLYICITQGIFCGNRCYFTKVCADWWLSW